jgi:hypothetical protein
VAQEKSVANATNKTIVNDADVANFVAQIADDAQRADAAILLAMLMRVSGEAPKMWGPSIIGFGHYHYRYDSGREGDMCRIGFSPRKGKTVLYINDGFPKYAELLARLGKHKTGKSCLYLGTLSAVDLGVLESLCVASLDHMAQAYPQ